MKKLLLLLVLMFSMALGGCGQSNGIDKAKAKKIALEHAGLKEADVNFVKVEREKDDGRSIYEVEFYSKDFKEYDYDIDAETGEIISYDSDAENYKPGNDTQANTEVQSSNADEANTDAAEITPERAKEIALAKVPGASEADIREFEPDYDDGRKVYEGKIIYDKTEYDFEIDAATGDIRKWESESVYD